jgi:hypothetical protein
VQVFTLAGEFVRMWGREGVGDGEFKRPVGLAATSERVYVIDVVNHRVQVFDRDGAFLYRWGRTVPRRVSSINHLPLR